MTTETQTQTQTIAEFLAKYPINLTLVEVPENPQMDDSDKMLNYHATLSFEGRVMSLYFSTGCGWVETRVRVPQTSENRSGFEWKHVSMVTYDKKHKQFNRSGFGKKEYDLNGDSLIVKYRVRKPTASDILDCIASDASGVDNSRNFEDWASDYGYDTDSRKALATYDACAKTGKDLLRLLGREAYSELLNNTERL